MLSLIIDDLLIRILSFLAVPDLLHIRMTCKRLHTASKLRIVWTNAANSQILAHSYPFPHIPLENMTEVELEQKTRRAVQLASNWRSPLGISSGSFGREKLRLNEDTIMHGPILDVKFVPGRGDRWILTVTRSVWNILTLWDIGNQEKGIVKLCEWSPRRAMFNTVCLNSDEKSVGAVALMVVQDGIESIQILSIKTVKSGELSLVPVKSIETAFKPMTLRGNLIAFSDDNAQTIVWDWSTDKYALLQHSSEELLLKRFDQCCQVLFAHESVLVVRARSIYLFPMPLLDDHPRQYEPLASHSFGWIDGISAAINIPNSECLGEPNISILVRAESEDLWTRERARLDLYCLSLDPLYTSSKSQQNLIEGLDAASPSPYIFPPFLRSYCPSVSGTLRCRDVFLGSYGTAVWILPRDSASAGLVSDELYSSLPDRIAPQSAPERIAAAMFPPSPLLPEGDTGILRGVLALNQESNWTAMDYDEVGGRTIVGSFTGGLILLEV